MAAAAAAFASKKGGAVPPAAESPVALGSPTGGTKIGFAGAASVTSKLASAAASAKAAVAQKVASPTSASSGASPKVVSAPAPSAEDVAAEQRERAAEAEARAKVRYCTMFRCNTISRCSRSIVCLLFCEPGGCR